MDIIKNENGSLAIPVTIIATVLIIAVAMMFQWKINNHVSEEVQSTLDSVASSALKHALEDDYVGMQQLHEVPAFSAPLARKTFIEMIENTKSIAGQNVHDISISGPVQIKTEYSKMGFSDDISRPTYILQAEVEIVMDNPVIFATLGRFSNNDEPTKTYTVRVQSRVVYKGQKFN